MNKNWLIRTKNNHILGPLSKEKVRELYYSNSIKEEDEICSGNGYWFYIKEKSLVEKYLIGDQIQGYNIVSEADSVLTVDVPIDESVTEINDDIDLENSESEENSLVHPEDDDLEYPDMGLDTEDEALVQELTVDKETETTNIPKLNEEEIKSTISNSSPSLKKKNDFLLYLLALVFLAMAIIAFMNRKLIISKFITQLNVFPQAYAQESASTEFVKKKSVMLP